MTTTTAAAVDAGYLTPLYGMASIPPGHPLPQPWYSADRRELDCELCGEIVDELWPLLEYPPDPDAALSPGELCVCRRCAQAVRPAVPASHPTHQPAA